MTPLYWHIQYQMVALTGEPGEVLDIQSGRNSRTTQLNGQNFQAPRGKMMDLGFYYQKYEEPTEELLKDINSAPKLNVP